jgi:hypothetical protein
LGLPFVIDEEIMSNQTKWSDLLKAAVTEPGLILKAYSAFHGYVRHAI